MTYIKLYEAIASIARAGYAGSQGEAIVEICDATEALRALPTVSVTDDDIERIALQNAKEYLQGAGPWKLDEISIASDDYLVKCFAKAIREPDLGATVSDEWEDISSAPRDGTLFLAICPTGAGHPHYMHPFVMRHEGKLYSTFQYNNGAKWVDWPKPDPTNWKPLGPLPAPPTIGE